MSATERGAGHGSALRKELRRNPLLWLLMFVPAVFVAHAVEPEAHTLLFVLAVLAIVPLAAVLSHATESVAAKTGDTTTGYGDIVSPREWQLLGAIEAITGILMCGWSTGFFFAIVSRMFKPPMSSSFD